MGYGWATIFTVGAWLVGGFLDGLWGSWRTLGLNTFCSGNYRQSVPLHHEIHKKR
ncbi:MAG: hypothetical protein ACLUSL_13380 [Ruminococcus sp.]